MAYLADSTRETTTTTGTGAITTSGTAPAGAQTLATAYGSVATDGVTYRIETQTTKTEWEVGIGNFNGTTGLTREVVLTSSNANALVNFSAGTKDVFVVIPAALMTATGLGSSIAAARGFNLN